MHRFFGSLLKGVLWFVFFVVAGTFVYGWMKFDFHTLQYITFLNTMDIQSIFLSSGSLVSSELSEENVLSGDISSETGLDVYDPNFEAELNAMTGTNVVTGTQDGFGFKDPYVSSGAVSSGVHQDIQKTVKLVTGDDKKEILDLLKREK